MRISHGTRIADINDTNGYGYATVNMIASLQRLGYEVNQNDKKADVEIWFDQPQHWKFQKGVYKIGYHPWESTQLMDGWADIMNQCDEIWTPSALTAKWYKQYAGITVPVYVYEHGVADVWMPHERKVDGQVKFLHMGMEALRKGGSETMRAFRAAFPNRTDVELTMKTISPGMNLPTIGRTKVINRRMNLEELIQLYYDNHVFVYPSWGEGFGLSPLQAMATGMPTVAVSNWAPYHEYMDPNLKVSSLLVSSPWRRGLHPGRMFKPNFNSLVESLRFAEENYEDCQASAMARVDAIKARYDWDTITKEVFESLEKRLEIG
jgi:glycosyltransferase involved in cell wall biosynthesis